MARRGPTGRGGFTLVEMLVSVALVLLIMTLFAQAFGIAAGAIRTQRGIAENDQRARSMVTVLLGDLRKRTFRQREGAVTETIVPPADAAPTGPPAQLVALENAGNRLSLGIVPLHPDYVHGGWDGGTHPPGAEYTGNSTRPVDQNRERGYFYYSEGDPTDDSDDVLQFTVDITQTDLGNEDLTPLIGRARLLISADPGGSAASWLTGPPGTPNNVDQPLWDDGKGFQLNALGVPLTYQPGDTGASQSRFAEVSYFIRSGRLHRRVLLIRDPLSHMEDADAGLGQPHAGADGSGVNMIDGIYDDEDGSPTAANTTDFWNDFDFSATWVATMAEGVNVYFNDIASLDNTIGGVLDATTPPTFARVMALGNPRSRFGHDPLPQSNSMQGRPKEYWNPNDQTTFFGRYTHEETSHPAFSFPGTPGYVGGPAGASPMSTGAGPLPGIVDANGDQRIDAFAGGPREGEDILLSNCHAFDVKIWDDEMGRFVDVGHPSTDADGYRGDYHIKQIVDTSQPWDPTPGNNLAGAFQAAQQGMARYGSLIVNPRAGRINRIFDTWHPRFDFDTSRDGRPGTGSPAVDGTGSADDVPPFRPLWSERDSFAAPLTAGGTAGAAPYLNGALPTLYDPDPASNSDGYDAGERVFPRPDQSLTPDGTFHGHQSFFYVATPAPGSNGTDMAPGAGEPLWPESPGGSVRDGEILWKAINNTIGLKAIQISVRFYDPTSGQMRQLTLTHSFVEL